MDKKKEENLPAVRWVKEKDWSKGLTGGDNLPAEVKKEELDLMLKEDFETNLQGIVPRLPQVKINHQESFFVFPSDEKGNPKQVKSFICVIMHKQAVNAFWPEPGLGNPPECSSKDGITGTKYGKCGACRHNQFGTAKNAKGETMPGKACKNMHRLHLLFKDHALPWRLIIPPTSLVSLSEFMSGLTDLRIPYTSLYIKFELEKVQSDYTFSRVKLTTDSQLSVEDYFAIRDLKNQIISAIVEQEITVEEYTEVPDDDFPPMDEEGEIE